MRALVLAAILAASPAMSADLPVPGEPWSVDVHRLSAGRSVDTVVTAEPYGTGWRIRLTCATTATPAGQVLAQRELNGVAVLGGRFVRGLLPAGGSFTLYYPEGSEAPVLASSFEDCASGHVLVGTGD